MSLRRGLMKHVVQKLSRKLRTIPTAILANCRKNLRSSVKWSNSFIHKNNTKNNPPVHPSRFLPTGPKSWTRFPDLAALPVMASEHLQPTGGARILAGPGSRLQEFNPENPQDFPANISSLWHLGVVRAVKQLDRDKHESCS